MILFVIYIYIYTYETEKKIEWEINFESLHYLYPCQDSTDHETLLLVICVYLCVSTVLL